jgi:hypothetical protein
MCLRHLLYIQQDLSLVRDTGTQRMREGERLILIHHREKCIVVLRTGQTVYLLLKLLALQTQEERCSYIGHASQNAFAGSRVLHRTTRESRAIHHVLPDAEATYTIYVPRDTPIPGPKTAIRAHTTSEPQTKSAVAAYSPDDTAILLLYLRGPSTR